MYAARCDTKQITKINVWFEKKIRCNEIEMFVKNKIDCFDVAFTQMSRIFDSMFDRKIVSSEKMFHAMNSKQCFHFVANDRELNKIFDIICEYNFKSFKNIRWMNESSKCVMFVSVCFFDLFKIYFRWRRLNSIAIFFESSDHNDNCFFVIVLRVKCFSKHTNCMQWKFACNENLHAKKICMRWKFACNKKTACNDFSNFFSWIDSTWMFCLYWVFNLFWHEVLVVLFSFSCFISCLLSDFWSKTNDQNRIFSVVNIFLIDSREYRIVFVRVKKSNAKHNALYWFFYSTSIEKYQCLHHVLIFSILFV